ncbi:putative reverse transcriptase domain-containing protein [Tanacetum coccineum]
MWWPIVTILSNYFDCIPDVPRRDRPDWKSISGGLPDQNIWHEKASKPKTMQEAIEFTIELMDEKTHQTVEAGLQMPTTTITINNNNRNNNNNNQKGNGCYECGAQGHFRRNCPKLRNNDRGNQAGNDRLQQVVMWLEMRGKPRTMTFFDAIIVWNGWRSNQAVHSVYDKNVRIPSTGTLSIVAFRNKRLSKQLKSSLDKGFIRTPVPHPVEPAVILSKRRIIDDLFDHFKVDCLLEVTYSQLSPTEGSIRRHSEDCLQNSLRPLRISKMIFYYSEEQQEPQEHLNNLRVLKIEEFMPNFPSANFGYPKSAVLSKIHCRVYKDRQTNDYLTQKKVKFAWVKTRTAFKLLKLKLCQCTNPCLTKEAKIHRILRRFTEGLARVDAKRKVISYHNATEIHEKTIQP